LIGIGTANLDKIYPKYRQQGTFEMNQGHLHNNLIQVAVIDGIPGMLAYLYIFIAMWAGYIKGMAGIKESHSRAVVFLGLAVSTAFFINGFFEYNLFSSQPALMFWFLTGLGYSELKPGSRNMDSGIKKAGKKK
jgi:O-antigen ligase